MSNYVKYVLKQSRQEMVFKMIVKKQHVINLKFCLMMYVVLLNRTHGMYVDIFTLYWMITLIL